MNIIMDHFKLMLEELPHLLEYAKPIIFYQNGSFRISSTVTTTWLVMLLIFIFVKVITSKLEIISTTRRQAVAEMITKFFYDFVYEICGDVAKKVYGIIGSLFIVILVMNFMWAIPTLTTPTASVSTTFAVALIGFGYSQMVIIKEKNIFKYMKHYVEPYPFMIIGHVASMASRPLSLSMRLFGNMFSGKILDTIIMLAIPLVVPIAFNLLGVLSGVIQAYVFALLITMYINEGIE